MIHAVSYDLNTPGQNYPAIQKRLEQLGAKRIQYSHWMLKSSMTASQLRDDLRLHIDTNDRLLVVDVTNAPMAWHNLQIEIKPTFNLS
jgi:CRISPR-associated endonuclease Cas2